MATAHRRISSSAPLPSTTCSDRHAVALRQRLAQAHPAAVGIAVQLAGRGLERGHRRGQRTERSLVRGELDDPLETELRLQLAHRPLGAVGLDRSQGVAQRHACSLRAMPDLLERFPLFPLGLVLLPGEVVPLHIFEERYKLMIGECLENGDRVRHRVALRRRPQGRGLHARTVTRVLDEMDDGRMNILVQGASPVPPRSGGSRTCPTPPATWSCSTTARSLWPTARARRASATPSWWSG